MQMTDFAACFPRLIDVGILVDCHPVLLTLSNLGTRFKEIISFNILNPEVESE